MRNHFHLALETPEPNLSEGVKWLQGTWVSRFNRLRKIQGRPFQGRFKSLLVQPGHSLAEVSHYIHLNPVRAKVVSVEEVSKFRWSSLHYFVTRSVPKFLDSLSIRSGAGGLADTPRGWRKYQDYLAFRGSDDPAARAIKFKHLSRGWSVGEKDFRDEMSNRLANQKKGNVRRFEGMSSDDWATERSLIWQDALERIVRETKVDLTKLGNRTAEPNKLLIAYLLKMTTDASNLWITERLGMGQPATVSQNVRRFKLAKRDEKRAARTILSRIKQCPLESLR